VADGSATRGRLRRPRPAGVRSAMVPSGFSGEQPAALFGRLRVVFLVADVLAPGHGAAAVVDFLHSEVRHEPIRRRAVPVFLAGLEVDAVARTDDLERAAPPLAAPDAFGDIDGLAERVGVPGGPCARREVDASGL
jgi:hypothetical protein